MNKLSVFSFESNQISAVVFEGKPAFVAMDVARALGYATPQKAIMDHCKSLKKIKCSEMERLGFAPIPQGITLIREADVYRLVMRSKLPSAERFQDWVVEEVLPALRENGHYGCKPALPDFSNPAAAARAWADEYEQKLIAQEKLSIAAPKAEVYDRIVRREGNNLNNATHVASRIKKSAKWMNIKLCELGVYNRSVKRGGKVFSQWFIDEGYGVMKLSEDGWNSPLFTPEGEAWVVRTFIDKGLI